MKEYIDYEELDRKLHYMLKQADKGFLKTKPNGEVSRSLKGKDLEGLTFV